MAVLPKKSALTDYSYRLSHDHQRAFLAALDARMISAGLATKEQAIFDLDFHAVLHWGADPALEKHYVPKRSQRARSVLTFFAQDSGTHNLVYANADISKATQAREVIAFCDHWKAVSGKDPAMLVMDQKVTTQQVLGELDERGVKFLTLRMRSPSLVRQISALTSTDFKTIALDRPGKYSRPKVAESAAVRLTSYPGTVRQLIVTGLGRDAPTVIISNDHEITTRAVIEQYARRMTIEQRLAEIIRAFHADALSSAVSLNVDLDVILAVLAQALLAALRARLPGYHAATPDTIQRRFPGTPGPDHHHRQHHHRPPRPAGLLTRSPESRPPRRHHRPLVGQPHPALRVLLRRCADPAAVGSGAGAVASPVVRSGSHFSPAFACGPLHCRDHSQVAPFPAPAASNRACGSPAHGSPTPFTGGIRLPPPVPEGPGSDDDSRQGDQPEPVG